MSTLSDNIILCSLREIAGWQINAKKTTGIEVAMPAMQRGYVWSASQVEGLWDSLVRQLPVGSFLVTQYRDELVSGKKSAVQPADKPEWLLLDGQQRATSVALAFFNPCNRPWTAKRSESTGRTTSCRN
ncbi:MAG: DUF262 domain-containing protein [Desulfovibrio sp.]|jgi:hypothetical protein|nr:DUF262 domain-containing protein [Desulfovibrio sp.]